MNTPLQQTISDGLFNGLKCETTDGHGHKWIGYLGCHNILTIISQNPKPILFDIKDLVNPIKISTYNNGEEFVPIDHINLDGETILFLGKYNDRFYLDFYYADGMEGISIKDFQRINNKLIEWHFNIHNLPPTDYINAKTSEYY